MDHSTKRSERITAVLSTIVAVVILAAGVTAQQSRSARTDVVVHLESDLRFQLESAFRLNPKQGLERVRQLEAVLATWRKAPQSAADRRLLADWLLEATIRSMPGSIEPLPATPQFGQSETLVTSPAPQMVEPAPDLFEKKHLVATAEALNPPSEPAPIGTTPAVSLATTGATHEPLPIVSAPTSTEPPFVEVSTKVVGPVPPKAVEPVVINLTELTARIVGYHRGLDEVEAALLVHERPQFERLSRQIRSLDGLTKDFQFVRLYYESLTPAERRTIAPPRSMEPTLEELRRHLDRLQREVEADFLGEFDTDMAKQLSDMRSQLDTIKSHVDW
jgi:hypothetical protein